MHAIVHNGFITFTIMQMLLFDASHTQHVTIFMCLSQRIHTYQAWVC